MIILSHVTLDQNGEQIDRYSFVQDFTDDEDEKHVLDSYQLACFLHPDAVDGDGVISVFDIQANGQRNNIQIKVEWMEDRDDGGVKITLVEQGEEEREYDNPDDRVDAKTKMVDDILKKLLAMRIDLFELYKELYPVYCYASNKGGSDEELEDFFGRFCIDPEGVLSTPLPRHFTSPHFKDFVHSSQNQFITNMASAIQGGMNEYQENDIEEDKSKPYLEAFGAKNMKEYFAYLKRIGVIHPELAPEKMGVDAAAAESRLFFQYFLLHLRQKCAEVDYVLTKDRPVVIKNISNVMFEYDKKCDENYAKTMRRAIAQQYRDDGTISGDRYNRVMSNLAQRFQEDSQKQQVLGGCNISCSSTIGTIRDDNEDTLIVGEAQKDYSDPVILQQELLMAARRVQEYQEQRQMQNSKYDNTVGSTAVVTHYDPNQMLTIANCGDSRASLFVVGEDNKVMTAKALTKDHNIEGNFFETQRIRAEGGEIIGDRIKKKDGVAGLNMARSIGDGYYGTVVSHQPDMYQYDMKQLLQNPDVKVALLVVSCDGLYESTNQVDLNEKCYIEAIQDWFENNNNVQEKWNANIAEYLQDYAIYMGSQDNISICVLDVTHVPEKPIIIGVFDGHAGREISHSLAAELSQSLLREETRIMHPDNVQSVLSPPLMERRLASAPAALSVRNRSKTVVSNLADMGQESSGVVQGMEI